MKIAVTAASGKLGSAIVKQLITEIGKDKVIGIARTPENAQHLGVDIRKGDYNSREQFDVALKGINTVLLVSSMAEPRDRIQQHRNVIEAAKANGVEKIVYTSIIGDENRTAFRPIVQSNRQTEEDVQASGLHWAIGRNGIYIEPDMEYIDTYVKEGGIRNCAEAGKCGYTSRTELAFAYTKMLLEDRHKDHIYNLVGQAITQNQLANLINEVYGTKLSYLPLSVEAYTADRVAALGDFLGTIVAGIYEGIQQGAYDLRSDFIRAAGREHLAPLAMIKRWQDEP